MVFNSSQWLSVLTGFNGSLYFSMVLSVSEWLSTFLSGSQSLAVALNGLE